MNQFNTTMRRLFGWAALATAATTGLLAVVFGVGWLPLHSATGPGMGALAVIVVIQAAFWSHFRRLTSAGDPR